MRKHHGHSDNPWQEQENFQNAQRDPVRAVTESYFCQEIDHKADKRIGRTGRLFLLISATILLTVCATSSLMPFYYPLGAIGVLWGAYFFLPKVIKRKRATKTKRGNKGREKRR